MPNKSIQSYAALGLLLASLNLQADEPLKLVLSGAAEVPPVATQASAAGQITVLPDRTISGAIRTEKVDGTMAHIHEAEAGKNGPPIITLLKSGEDLFMVPKDARLTKEQYVSFINGKLYLNVHSAAFPDGEIRAQLQHPKRLAHPLQPTSPGSQ